MAARPPAVELTPEAVERLAKRMVALLDDRQGERRDELISAGELALRLRVGRPWVYRNRRLLGGIRLGDGPKAPWRFEYAAAVEALRDLNGADRPGAPG